MAVTERKLQSIEVSFAPEMRSNRHTKFYNVLQTNFCVKISRFFYGLLPDFIPKRTRYESVNYGISNY